MAFNEFVGLTIAKTEYTQFLTDARTGAVIIPLRQGG